MKPPPFEYRAPGSLEEALELLAEHGDDARPLAGGQSLVPTMSFRLAAPAVLVDLNRVPGLAHQEAEPGGALRLGAMVRQRAAERSPLVAGRAPLLAEALGYVAHPQIRNRGTVGGSLAHADPAAELPAVAVALGARCRIRRHGDERTLPAAELYTGLFETALEPGELLVEVAIPPPPPRSGWAFEEFARRHGDYALAGVAATLALDADGRCAEARVVYLGVGEGPTEAPSAVAALLGQTPTEEAIRGAAADAAERDVDPPGDIHATAAYRRHLLKILTRRALVRAVERAKSSNTPSLDR